MYNLGRGRELGGARIDVQIIKQPNDECVLITLPFTLSMFDVHTHLEPYWNHTAVRDSKMSLLSEYIFSVSEWTAIFWTYGLTFHCKRRPPQSAVRLLPIHKNA